ncbi:MAG: glycosyltransferase [Nitrososphaerota archaeon]
MKIYKDKRKYIIMKIILICTSKSDFEVHNQILSKINHQRHIVFHSKSDLGKIISLILNAFFIPDADIYITENLFYYPAFRKMIFNKKAKIVELNCGPALYKTVNKETNPIVRSFLSYLLKYVDGIIFLDKSLKRKINKKNIHIPLYLVKNKENKLKGINPSYKSKVYFTIGNQDWKYKGFDYTMDIFYNLWSLDKSSKFTFYGTVKIPKKFIEKYPKDFLDNVKINGPEYDEKKLFGNKTIYIHSGRGDTFPLSSLEAMYCGIPAFISNTTGSHIVAKRISKEFVYDMKKEKPKEVAKRIFEFVCKGEKEYYKYSKKFKEITFEYTEDKMRDKLSEKIKKFVESFYE